MADCREHEESMVSIHVAEFLRFGCQGDADGCPVVADEHVAICVSRRRPNDLSSRIGIGRLFEPSAADLPASTGSDLRPNEIALEPYPCTKTLYWTRAEARHHCASGLTCAA